MKLHVKLWIAKYIRHLRVLYILALVCTTYIDDIVCRMSILIPILSLLYIRDWVLRDRILSEISEETSKNRMRILEQCFWLDMPRECRKILENNIHQVSPSLVSFTKYVFEHIKKEPNKSNMTQTFSYIENNKSKFESIDFLLDISHKNLGGFGGLNGTVVLFKCVGLYLQSIDLSQLRFEDQ